MKIPTRIKRSILAIYALVALFAVAHFFLYADTYDSEHLILLIIGLLMMVINKVLIFDEWE
ncbi:hypothetical protein [Flagellimonas sp.]|uniref:hypothetical protein n=1 Tax=Flagellimonas sp. TaxID=2058762 RepID=UPI003BA84391